VNVAAVGQPTLPELRKALADKSNTVVLLGRCKVEYNGRAASTAAAATRLVIIKPDGTVLIHGRTGHRPVNWQTAATILVNSADDKLQITATKKTPKETITIDFDEQPTMMAARLEDSEFKLAGSEADMVNLVVNNPSLIPDLTPPLQTELSTPHGKIDLFGAQPNGNPYVLEFKRGRAGLDAISQVKRYVEYIEETTRKKTKGAVVAPSITRTAKQLLNRNGFEYISSRSWTNAQT
jgi:RecB family endonuclease NucS